MLVSAVYNKLELWLATEFPKVAMLSGTRPFYSQSSIYLIQCKIIVYICLDISINSLMKFKSHRQFYYDVQGLMNQTILRMTLSY